MDPVSTALGFLTTLGLAGKAIADAANAKTVEAEANALAALDAEILAMITKRDALADALNANRVDALNALHKKFEPVLP